MKPAIAVFAAFILAPLAVEAATINSVADVQHRQEGVESSERKNESVDTASGTTSLSLKSRLLFGEDAALASSFYDHADMSFNLWSNAQNAAGGEPSIHWARSRFSTTSTYTASGDGTLLLSMMARGEFSELTDRDTDLPLAMILAGFSITTPEATVYKRASSEDPNSLFSDADGITITVDLFSEIEVKDGDEITIELFGLADAGDFPGYGYSRDYDVSSFEANARVRGNFLLSAEGTVLIEDTLDVAPVPIPAALPLLLAGFGGLAALGRRKRAT